MMASSDFENNKYFKDLVGISLPFVTLYTAYLYYYKASSDHAVSYSVGAILAIVNMLVLAYVLKSLFAQKSVAWASFLIVSKYPILGFIIYIMATKTWFQTIDFCVGFGGIILVAASLAMAKRKKLSKVN